jgi:hypothetical protein
MEPTKSTAEEPKKSVADLISMIRVAIKADGLSRKDFMALLGIVSRARVLHLLAKESKRWKVLNRDALKPKNISRRFLKGSFGDVFGHPTRVTHRQLQQH